MFLPHESALLTVLDATLMGLAGFATAALCTCRGSEAADDDRREEDAGRDPRATARAGSRAASTSDCLSEGRR